MADNLWPETVLQRTATFIAVGGKRVFKIPLECFFRNAAGETTLTINGNPQGYPLDYQHVHRSGAGVAITDTGIGFILPGPAGAGWVLVFTWLERRLLVDVPSLALVHAKLDGGIWVPDYDVGAKWKPSDPTDCPNAIQVPEPPPGYVAEFWRRIRKPGGGRQDSFGNVYLRGGIRYLPYERGPAAGTANSGLFLQTMFDPNHGAEHWTHFRVCYYRTATGARSPLSSEVIVSALGNRPYDEHNGSGPTRYNLWINR